jgi:hypothetical protein
VPVARHADLAVDRGRLNRGAITFAGMLARAEGKEIDVANATRAAMSELADFRTLAEELARARAQGRSRRPDLRKRYREESEAELPVPA